MNRSILFSAMAVAIACFASVTMASEPVVKTEPAATQPAAAPVPHCQVPCGIYGDQMRFEGMLEDTKTVAKAITEIETIFGSEPTAKGMNQMIRWVNNKESHAQNIQDVMAEYFLAQRIKSDNKDYTAQLAMAHKVIVTAMKCKQDASAPTAEALKAAILDFYRAYEGKEPDFHEDEK